jgi:DNA-binding Lrp family transcriptional regulator
MSFIDGDHVICMPNNSIPLDETERAILYYLQNDARNITNAEIADKIDVSATTVGQRINDLEDRGIIQNYHTMVDYERGGFPHRILLLCTVQPDNRAEAADDVIDIDGVISVRELITGEENLHVEIIGHTREEVVDTISNIEQVGIEVVDSEIIKNECRQPFDSLKPE